MKELIFICLLGVAYSSGAGSSDEDWDYFQQGEDWSDIHETCGSGVEQSPINVDSAFATAKSDRSLSLNYDPDDISYSVTYEHNYQLESKWGFVEVVDINDTALNYTALQFHFHSHSEHLINGSYFDLEMHIVHQNTDNEKADAVISVMF